MFDINTFLDQTTTEANSTQALPVPVGVYTAIIDDITARQWQSKKDPSLSGITLDVKWSVDDGSVKQLLDRQQVFVRQGIMLDITPAGGLDFGKGKNVSLGRLREAVDLNQPGVPFSFAMLKGRIAKIQVEHRIDDQSIPRAEVKAVARLA